MSDYKLYFDFLDKYIPQRFENIDRKESLIKQLELFTKNKHQFFFVADLVDMKILFCSNRSIDMIGVEPENISPYVINQATHLSDSDLMASATANRVKEGISLLKEMKGHSLYFSNMRMKNPDGFYANVFYQCYTFYCPHPKHTVYQLQIHTNIDGLNTNGKRFHYCGNDLSKFCYPDAPLLESLTIFSNRELEILKLLGKGFSSEQIASQLFVSIHTVNTHRRNIMQKSGDARMAELISHLKEQGIL